jgi:hypothetical protein
MDLSQRMAQVETGEQVSREQGLDDLLLGLPIPYSREKALQSHHLAQRMFGQGLSVVLRADAIPGIFAFL